MKHDIKKEEIKEKGATKTIVIVSMALLLLLFAYGANAFAESFTMSMHGFADNSMGMMHGMMRGSNGMNIRDMYIDEHHKQMHHNESMSMDEEHMDEMLEHMKEHTQEDYDEHEEEIREHIKLCHGYNGNAEENAERTERIKI